jgi:hypothetical protein
MKISDKQRSAKFAGRAELSENSPQALQFLAGRDLERD